MTQLTYSPYSSVSYRDPHFEPWKQWYAWYPVQKHFYVSLDDSLLYGIKAYRWIWLQSVYRRRVSYDPHYDYNDKRLVSWEYASLFEILKKS